MNKFIMFMTEFFAWIVFGVLMPIIAVFTQNDTAIELTKSIFLFWTGSIVTQYILITRNHSNSLVRDTNTQN
jgi:hypothetical protein